MIRKGQVSTEYLVILAVVLVVALVVVFLVGGFSGLGAGSIETQSKNYWAGASPFSLKTYRYAGTEVMVEVVNNDIDQLTLTDITVDGTSVYSTNTVFDSGESTVINATMATACGSTGDPFQLENVVITYNKGGITGITQAGVKPIVGKCS